MKNNKAVLMGAMAYASKTIHFNWFNIYWKEKKLNSEKIINEYAKKKKNIYINRHKRNENRAITPLNIDKMK